MTDGSVISEKLYRELLERDEYACLHCNGEEDLQPAHYIARSRRQNKEETVDDYMLLCNKCHRALHDRRLVVVRVKGHFFFGQRRKY
jgi:5-methylcytosine-specific restriction endonuclease McrA